jgi:hypothetical protein
MEGTVTVSKPYTSRLDCPRLTLLQGEHGVGLVKRDYLPHELGETTVDAMRKVREASIYDLRGSQQLILVLTSRSKPPLTRSASSTATRSCGCRSPSGERWLSGDEPSVLFISTTCPSVELYTPSVSRAIQRRDFSVRADYGKPCALHLCVLFRISKPNSPSWAMPKASTRLANGGPITGCHRGQSGRYHGANTTTPLGFNHLDSATWTEWH